MLNSRSRIASERTLTPSFSPLRLDSLNLKPKSRIEIYEALQCGIDLESEKKLKQSILELWHCIKNNTKLQITPPNFKSSDSLSKALNFIVDAFGQVKNKNTEYSFGEDHDNKWIIREYRVISTGDGMNGACIQVNFLSELKKINKPLYSIILKCFQFIIQKTNSDFVGIGIQYDDHIREMLTERLHDTEEDIATRAEINQSLKSHQNGLIAATRKLLYNAPKVTYSSLRQEILHCKGELFNCKAAGDVLEWAKKISEFLEAESHSLNEFDYNPVDPNMEDGYPVFYSQTLGFYWHPKDPFFQENDQLLQASSNEMGVLEPVTWRHWTKDGIRGELIESNWPSEFFELCKDWNVNIYPKIEKQYEFTDTNY